MGAHRFPVTVTKKAAPRGAAEGERSRFFGSGARVTTLTMLNEINTVGLDLFPARSLTTALAMIKVISLPARFQGD